MDRNSIRKKSTFQSGADNPSSETRTTIQFNEYPKTVDSNDDTDERPSKVSVQVVVIDPKMPIGKDKEINKGQSSEQVNNPKEYPFVVEIPEQSENPKKKKGSFGAKPKDKLGEQKKKEKD